MPADFTQLARPEVRAMHPYVPGKPVEEAQRELGLESIVKLASNENPRGPSALVREAIEGAVAEVNRYPDGNGYYLKCALAEFIGVPTEGISLGNGSNDVLELIASAYLRPGDNAVYSQHAFVVYALATARSGAASKVVPANAFGHDLDAIAKSIDQNTRVVFLANPNNPTGTCFTHDELTGFLAKVPSNTVVVLDEAYIEYARALSDRYEVGAYPNAVSLLADYPNLVITRTFSKAYGLSGLRVGYALSSASIADMLNRVRQPFNVNSIALAAAVAAIKDQSYLKESVEINTKELCRMAQFFKARDIDFIRSFGNFISFSCAGLNKSASELEQDLLRLGVIVRPVGVYEMPDYLRVSIGIDSENQRFMSTLDELRGRD